MLRSQNSLKVRQPLKILEIKLKNKKLSLSKEFLEILEQELNIKKVKIVSQFSKKHQAVNSASDNFDLELEIYLDEALIQEGITREIIRNIQELRQKANLTPKDKITLYLSFSKNLDFLKTQKDFFKKETNASQVLFTKVKNKYQNLLKLDNDQEILISIKINN
jgi:valyl-tRNA synthetase